MTAALPPEVAEVIDEVIAPAAVEVDSTEVPATHLKVLARTGYFGWWVPSRHGGTPRPPDAVADVDEALAGACPSTQLIASQHATAVRAAQHGGSAALTTYLPQLATGELIGGAAFGHVRTWPNRRTLRATRTEGGWRLDGSVPWMSGAGLVDLVYLGAVDEVGGAFLFVLADMNDERIVSRSLELAAVGGSRTVSLTVTGLLIPDDHVVERVPAAVWRAQDGSTGRLAYPSAIGLSSAAIGDARTDASTGPALDALERELNLVVAADRVGLPADTPTTDRDRWRARSIDLAVRATRAAVVARGGRALLRGDIAQVRARAALFLHVRGLTDGLRQAHYAELAPR